ncbi:putative NADH-ubiquinone reductase complex 1 MLRQ subunit [Helianthus annuus]|nr:putative NADH-ubiquinone reductase complex 1 MLRQ subunit [Helianthus annuus]
MIGNRKSESVARMKRTKGIWRFRRTVHGISYINDVSTQFLLHAASVYPLFAAVGVAVGICRMQLVRNISGNPEVRYVSITTPLFYLSAVILKSM